MTGRVSLNSRWGTHLLAAILLAGTCGCGRTATVTGTVAFRGKPVIYGSVTFQSADRTTQSAPILSDGSYTVEGVHPGEVRIGVISRDPSKGRPALQGEKSAPPGKKGAAPKNATVPGWFALPRKYENPETSGLDCTVGAGQNEHKIDLE